MLPTLRKLPACAWIGLPCYSRAAAFGALGVAAILLAPCIATAQRNKKPGVPPKIGTPHSIGSQTTSSVLTYHGDNQRTGLNNTETAFITAGANANLSSQTFGKIWSRTVDGSIYTQPLYVPSVKFPNVPDILNSSPKGGVYNAVFVATTHNSVYAFDAGSSVAITHVGSTSTAVRSLPLWRHTFNFPMSQIGPVPSSDVLSDDIQPEIGIVGTPVITTVTDPATGYRSGTLYVVVKTKEGNDYAQRLHALDITTGNDKVAPALIQAAVLGTGDGAILDPSNGDAPTVFFDPLWQNQQAGLTLSNGLIYVTWGSHGDNGPFHGWVIAYNASTLQPVAAYNTSPNGDSSGLSYPAGAGIWQGGAPPSVDENGNLFFATGAGLFDASPSLSGGTEYGNSVVKLQIPAGGSGTVLDYFTPNNWESLSNNLLDLGSGGVMVLPPVGNLASPHLAVAAGTEGTIYLMDRDNLGQFASTADNVVQSIPNAVGPIYGLPAFFNNTLYYQGTGDVMKAFQFQTGTLNPTPVSQSTTQFEFPGATPTITSSADGSNGVVWAVERMTPPPVLPGFGFPERAPFSVLHAYDASDLTHELFTGLNKGARDLARSATYSPPTVINGRAYVGGGGELAVYGNFAENGVVPKANEADHYLITGPDSSTQRTGNWFSITAIGPDGGPIKLTGTVHLSTRTLGGPTTNITTLNFKGQSNLIFNYAFPQPGIYEFYANDDDGNSTYIPDIDIMPFGTLFPETFVSANATPGPDHLVVKAPSTAKAGSKISVQVTPVTKMNSPYTWYQNGANFFVPFVGTQVTLPNGTQGAIPGFPGYAYADGPDIPFKLNAAAQTVQVTVPGVGNHVIIVSGTVNYFYGTDPANPTTVISYQLSGTAAVIGVP
jgi:hypothetical protein